MKTLLLFCLSFFITLAYTSAQNSVQEDSAILQLKAKIHTTKHDTIRMLIYSDIALYYVGLQKKDSALLYVQKAELLANRYPNCPRIAEVWKRIGNFWYTVRRMRSIAYPQTNSDSNSFKALRYYERAMVDAKRLGNEDVYIAAYDNLAAEYHDLGDQYNYFKNSLSLINYLQSKKLLTEIDSTILGQNYFYMCIYLDYIMDTKLYTKYFNQLEKFITKENPLYNEVKLLKFEQLVNSSTIQDESQILSYYHTLKKDINEDEKITRIHLNYYLATYYFNIGKYHESMLLTANRSFNEGSKFDNYATMGIYLENTGKCEYELGKYENALISLNKAYKTLKVTENTLDTQNEIFTVLSYLSKIYEKKGDYKQAYDYYKQAEETYKKLTDKQTIALMAENEVQVEQIKQDKKIQEAQTQTLLREQEIQIEKRQKYVFMALLGLALLLAGGAIYNYIRKNRLNQALAIEKATVQQQAQELQSSNQAKDKLFTLIGHDLRSPIASLKESLTIWNTTGSPSLKNGIESRFNKINTELENVQLVLNNLLNWSGMQIKKMGSERQPISSKYLLESIIKQNESNVNAKNLTVVRQLTDEQIEVDENQISVVIRNLLSNAIKFTAEGGYIRVQNTLKEGVVQLIIEDTGIGMTPEQLNNVFNYPSPQKGTNGEKGTGLGLGLCKELVEGNGGTIQIKSTLNKGTKVTLSFPLHSTADKKARELQLVES